MNRKLLAGLVLTILATGWAEFWPISPPDPMPMAGMPASTPRSATELGAMDVAAPQAHAEVVSPNFSGGAATKAQMPYRPLPAALQGYDLQPAAGDPFSPPAPPPPSLVAAPLPTPIAPVAPPRPQPPAFGYRYFGQMTTPSGDIDYYLVKGDKPVRAVAGQQLDDGYVVASLSPTAIRIKHPLLDTPIEVPVPARSKP